MTIATSKPKSSEIVVDIPERLLSTPYGAWFPGFCVSMSSEPFRDIKKPEPADQASRRSLYASTVIVPRRYCTMPFWTGQEEGTAGIQLVLETSIAGFLAIQRSEESRVG